MGVTFLIMEFTQEYIVLACAAFLCGAVFGLCFAYAMVSDLAKEVLNRMERQQRQRHGKRTISNTPK